MWKAMLLVFALELSMLLFVQDTFVSTHIFGFLFNNFLWSESTFMKFLLPSIALLGAGATIIGSFFNNVDWVFRATIVAVFITYGASITHLYAYILGIGLFGGATKYLAAVLVAPLLLFYIGASVDFISGKD